MKKKYIFAVAFNVLLGVILFSSIAVTAFESYANNQFPSSLVLAVIVVPMYFCLCSVLLDPYRSDEWWKNYWEKTTPYFG